MPNVRKHMQERFMNVDWFLNEHGEDLSTTIKMVSERPVGNRKRLVAYFADSERGLVLGTEQLEQLCQDFGSEDSDAWRGRKVTLYYDRGVTFNREQVGGIRMRGEQA